MYPERAQEEKENVQSIYACLAPSHHTVLHCTPTSIVKRDRGCVVAKSLEVIGHTNMCTN